MCKQSTSELKTEKAATKRAQLWFSHKSKMEVLNSILAVVVFFQGLVLAVTRCLEVPGIRRKLFYRMFAALMHVKSIESDVRAHSADTVQHIVFCRCNQKLALAQGGDKTGGARIYRDTGQLVALCEGLEVVAVLIVGLLPL